MCYVCFKRKDRPWNIIPTALSGEKKNVEKELSRNSEKFVGKIKKFMTENILTMDDVEKKLALKEWNKKNKAGLIIPMEFNVQKWTQFLPH